MSLQIWPKKKRCKFAILMLRITRSTQVLTVFVIMLLRLKARLSTLAVFDQQSVITAELHDKTRMLASKKQELDNVHYNIRSLAIQLAPHCCSCAKPLHSCFRFKNAAACQELQTALETIAGKSDTCMAHEWYCSVAIPREVCVAGRFLNVYVADNIQEASNSLGILGEGNRIWALDCLQLTDKKELFKKAAGFFGAGEERG